jgi:hypothetical protein
VFVKFADLPKADQLAHGTHARYVAGCRCADCRKGHAAYNVARYRAQKLHGDWNGLVDAGAARRHIRALAKTGVGRRAVAAACDVSLTVIEDVKSGAKRQIRARTEKRILAVTKDAIADHATVSAKATWRRIDTLIEEGFSKAELARRLGFKRPALQFGRERVLARTALKVEKFYRQVMT